MEGGFGVEDGEDEFGGELAIDFDAGFDELVEVHAAFEGEEGSEAFGGELRGGFLDGLDELEVFAGGGEEAGAAEGDEGAADFGLEDDDEDDAGEEGDAADEFHAEEVSGDEEGEDEDGDLGGDLGAIGAAEVAPEEQEEASHEENLKDGPPVLCEKVSHERGVQFTAGLRMRQSNMPRGGGFPGGSGWEDALSPCFGPAGGVVVGELEFAVGEADDEEAFGGAGGVRGFGVAVFLRGGAHEDRVGFPCVLGEGVFVAVEDQGDVIGSEDGFEGGEVGGLPPFFETPAAETVVPHEDDWAAGIADGGAEVVAEEVETAAGVIPWGGAVVDRARFVAWEEVEIDEMEGAPVP